MNDEIVRLLGEVRDTQREHLAFYREVAERSLAAQQQAIEVSRAAARFYRIVVGVGAVLIVALAVGAGFLIARNL